MYNAHPKYNFFTKIIIFFLSHHTVDGLDGLLPRRMYIHSHKTLLDSTCIQLKGWRTSLFSPLVPSAYDLPHIYIIETLVMFV